MSRAYKVEISESVSRIKRVGDGFKTSLQILDVLPREAMSPLLKADLESRGFEDVEGQMVRQLDEDVLVTIDVRTYEIELACSDELNVALEKTKDVWCDDDFGGRDSKRHEARLREELEREADQKERELQEALTKKLSDALEGIQKEMDEVGNRISVEALKRKAATMGEITEVNEDAKTGEVVIKVRV
jgi:hypothetical protein